MTGPEPNLREDCRLFPHANGPWARKLKGKVRYYGSRDDPDGALAKYQVETHPRPTSGAAPNPTV